MLNKIGTTEIIVVAVVLLLLFGGKKLPELAKGLGEAIKNIKEGIGGQIKDDEDKK